MNRVDMIAPVVLACCVLHNICLEGLAGINDDVEDFIREGRPHANLRGNPQEQNINGVAVEVAPVDNDGEAKRNYLVTIVPRVL
ncbi:Putative nuclease [Frankliniella fusca]|uniref:Nuclease n=1 Tax=Frankliniella fusca TaxID=407009 RepID=A0AAE1HGI7_9NEOP|nr:Putative nuclease [Frankliniella fusca]